MTRASRSKRSRAGSSTATCDRSTLTATVRPSRDIARAIDLAHAAAADAGFQSVRTELRAFQVLLRPSDGHRDARRLEEIAGSFVRIKEGCNLAVKRLVSEADLCDERSALRRREREGSIEGIPHTRPLFGTHGGHDLR